MTLNSLLLPLLVQVALTFGLHLWMVRLRVGAVQRGEVRRADVALRQPGWPPRATQIANSYHSQLELPLLFYVLIALLLITNTANYLLLVLAWIFVLSRLVHAFVHTTSNAQPQRFYTYALGVIVLLAMWIVFAVRVLSGPSLA